MIKFVKDMKAYNVAIFTLIVILFVLYISRTGKVMELEKDVAEVQQDLAAHMEHDEIELIIVTE